MLGSIIGKYLRRPRVACLRYSFLRKDRGCLAISHQAGQQLVFFFHLARPLKTFVPSPSRSRCTNYSLSPFALPYFLASFLLGCIIEGILTFHKVTPRSRLLSRLEPSRCCFCGLNSVNLQNFTTLSAVGQRSGSCNSIFRVLLRESRRLPLPPTPKTGNLGWRQQNFSFLVRGIQGLPSAIFFLETRHMGEEDTISFCPRCFQSSWGRNKGDGG